MLIFHLLSPLLVAYGVRQKALHIEKGKDYSDGSDKFNVHVLLEVSDADLTKAKKDFADYAHQVRAPKPKLRSAEEVGFLGRLVRKIGL